MERKANECKSCGYRSDKGYWIGTAYTSHGVIVVGDMVELEEEVDTPMEDLHWNLDSLVHGVKEDFDIEVYEMEGDAHCPECKSENYFALKEYKEVL